MVEYAAAVPDVVFVATHNKPTQTGVLHTAETGMFTATQLAPLFCEKPTVVVDEVEVTTQSVPVHSGSFQIAPNGELIVVAFHVIPSSVYAAMLVAVALVATKAVPNVTVKFDPDFTVPPVFVTAIGPVVAPTGTVVVIELSDTTV